MIGEIKVLDHGYIRFIEAWGHGDAGQSDRLIDGHMIGVNHDYECGIIEAARQSTQGSFRGWEEDEKLLKSLYLSEPQHSTPFEFAGAVIELQAPILVFREWHRHRTQSYNEMSARYAPMPNTNYVVGWGVLKTRGEAAEKSRNKQEKGTHPWNEVDACNWHYWLLSRYELIEKWYQEGLEAGVPKEIARCVIPVGRYSRMRASANLRNWLAFITLRHDPNAQWEIRQYAAILAEILKEKFPKTWALYVEKNSPQHRMKRFTTDELSAEIFRRAHEAK